MSDKQLNIFLSYPSERLEQAREVFNFLKSVGFNPWFDKESLLGGQDWDYERAKAQKCTDLHIFIVAPEASERNGVIHREIGDALTMLRDHPRGDIFIIPLRAAADYAM